MAATWEEPPVLYQQLDATSLVFGPPPPSAASPPAFPPATADVDAGVNSAAAALSDPTAGQSAGVSDNGTRAVEGVGRGGDNASIPVGKDGGDGGVEEDDAAADVAVKPSRCVPICAMSLRALFIRL